MIFFINLFTSKRGSLAKIWLAAHWERKLTKAHVFECNLESVVKEIISPEMKIGLRTSGHLLLGVVRIFSRKAKYLLADCNGAFLKINVTFRPGLTDLPEDAREATARAITLSEDFTSFDCPLPQLSDLDVLDNFSLNQSRAEEITLKEDFGNGFLNFAVSGEESQAQPTVLDISFQSLAHEGDGFGDEDKGLDLLNFLANSSDHALLSDVMEPSNQNSKNPSLHDKQDVDTEEPMEAENSTFNKSTMLSHDQVFTLKPVSVSASVEMRKRLKRKRKLVVDRAKELSSKTIKNQIADYSDLVTSLDMAPPTRTLMRWKESGGADKLFSQMCTAVTSPHIKELFSRSLKSPDVSLEVEEMRQQELQAAEQSRDHSLLSLCDSSLGQEKTNICELSSELTVDKTVVDELLQDENRSDFTLPELPSEDSLFVHPSAVPPNTHSTQQSVMNSQECEERRITRRAQSLHHSLKSCNDTTFSVRALCAGNNRLQAANTFSSLLVLKKQKVVQLHQKVPYEDIQVTPGPKFFSF